MTDQATPDNARLTDGLGQLPPSRWPGFGRERVYSDAYSADQMREYALREVAVTLHRELDATSNAADRSIEHARRIDAKERDALRSALQALVQIYVIDGAATAPAVDIGNAWKAAQSALLMA